MKWYICVRLDSLFPQSLLFYIVLLSSTILEFQVAQFWPTGKSGLAAMVGSEMDFFVLSKMFIAGKSCDTRPGKHLHNYWKDPPFSMGKLTISMAIFNSFLYVYQRVIHLALDLGFSDDHQSPAEPSLAQETKNGSPRSTDNPPLCSEQTPQKQQLIWSAIRSSQFLGQITIPSLII